MKKKQMEKTPIEMIGILPDEQFKLAKNFIDFIDMNADECKNLLLVIQKEYEAATE